jgi:hypothetical protein
LPELGKRANRVKHSASHVQLAAIHGGIKVRAFSLQKFFDESVNLFLGASPGGKALVFLLPSLSW